MEKHYLIQIKTKGKEQIFVISLNGKKELQTFIEINYPRNKLTAFLLKEVMLVKK